MKYLKRKHGLVKIHDIEYYRNRSHYPKTCKDMSKFENTTPTVVGVLDTSEMSYLNDKKYYDAIKELAQLKTRLNNLGLWLSEVRTIEKERERETMIKTMFETIILGMLLTFILFMGTVVL